MCVFVLVCLESNSVKMAYVPDLSDHNSCVTPILSLHNAYTYILLHKVCYTNVQSKVMTIGSTIHPIQA